MRVCGVGVRMLFSSGDLLVHQPFRPFAEVDVVPLGGKTLEDDAAFLRKAFGDDGAVCGVRDDRVALSI